MNVRGKSLLTLAVLVAVGLGFALGWSAQAFRPLGQSSTPVASPAADEKYQLLSGEIEKLSGKLDQLIAQQVDQNRSQPLQDELKKLSLSVTELRTESAETSSQIARIRSVTETLLAESQLRYDNLVATGVQLFIAREFEQAIAEFSAAIDVNPRGYMAHINRGAAYQELGNWRRALADFDRASQLDPDNYVAINNAAWIRATCPEKEFRDGTLAVELAQRACEMTEWKKPFALSTLAAAHAEKGEFDLAIQRQQEALKADVDADTKRKMNTYLKRFEAGEPYRIGTADVAPNTN